MFESRSEYLLSYLRLYIVFLSPSMKILGEYIGLATNPSFQIPYNLYFIYHTTIRSQLGQMLTALKNYPRQNR
jgi:hypothetical protein